MTIARHTITRAEFFIAQAEAVAIKDRQAFTHYLEAAIVFLRSVTLHLQKEFSATPGFDDWYSTWQQRMGANPLSRFLLEQRNYVLKEGPLTLGGHTHITIRATAVMQASVSIVIKRALPWYRRPLRIIVSDLTWPLRERFRVWRQNLATVKTRVTESTATVDKVVFYFADSDWSTVPALELLRRQLSLLDELVLDAEARFL